MLALRASVAADNELECSFSSVAQSSRYAIYDEKKGFRKAFMLAKDLLMEIPKSQQ